MRIKSIIVGACVLLLPTACTKVDEPERSVSIIEKTEHGVNDTMATRNEPLERRSAVMNLNPLDSSKMVLDIISNGHVMYRFLKAEFDSGDGSRAHAPSGKGVLDYNQNYLIDDAEKSVSFLLSEGVQYLYYENPERS